MPSDHEFSASLVQTIASLKAWTGFVADVARVEEIEGPVSWKLGLKPYCARACPIEIVLRDDLHYDVTIAGEVYQACPLHSLDVFLPLMEAIADGHVLTRQISSAATGIPRQVTTVVRLADGRLFENGVLRCSAVNGSEGSSTVVRDTHYLPYRRPKGSQF